MDGARRAVVAARAAVVHVGREDGLVGERAVVDLPEFAVLDQVIVRIGPELDAVSVSDLSARRLLAAADELLAQETVS